MDIATSYQWYSQAFIKHLIHLKTSIGEHISCFEGIEPSRQASARPIRSNRTTREQPVNPRVGVRVFRVRVRVDGFIPGPGPVPIPKAHRSYTDLSTFQLYPQYPTLIPAQTLVVFAVFSLEIDAKSFFQSDPS